MKHLFIGGHADGTWRHVPPGARKVAVSVPGPVMPADREHGRPRAVMILEQELYLALQIGGEQEQWTVYRLDTLHPDQVVALLITGYLRAGLTFRAKVPLPAAAIS